MLAVWSLVAAGLFGTGLARSSVAPAAVGKEQREFDYFALALQWPGTICSSTRHCCAVNGCCRYVLRPPLLLSPHRRLIRARGALVPVGWGGVSGAPEIRFDSPSRAHVLTPFVLR
uniref:Uncharacterized protein n=1 Tax=Aegilops tauschii subsp. strangulata TaxID=200361 RepID=A0A453G580_AEGTS